MARRSRPWETDKGHLCTGYRVFVSDQGKQVLGMEAWNECGVGIIAVTGVKHVGDVLQSPAFTPGQPVQLVPDPANEYDRDAVGVWDAERMQRVGWAPKKQVPWLSAALQAGKPIEARVLQQFKNRDDGTRVGLRVVIAPPNVMGAMTSGTRPYKET